MQNIVNRDVLNLYYRICKVDSPARRLMQFVLARYTTWHYSSRYFNSQGSVHRESPLLESPVIKELFKKTALMVTSILSGDYFLTTATMPMITRRNIMVLLVTMAMQSMMMYAVMLDAFICFYISIYISICYS